MSGKPEGQEGLEGCAAAVHLAAGGSASSRSSPPARLRQRPIDHLRCNNFFKIRCRLLRRLLSPQPVPPQPVRLLLGTGGSEFVGFFKLPKHMKLSPVKFSKI